MILLGAPFKILPVMTFKHERLLKKALLKQTLSYLRGDADLTVDLLLNCSIGIFAIGSHDTHYHVVIC